MNDVKDFRTVRVTFRKLDRARYISHLDLNRTMTRAVRRAGLPIWYTEGFNRHPYLTFASPLSLGFEGEHETMDIRLESDMDLTELATRLNSVMPEGLEVIGAAWAIKKAGEVDRATYRVEIACPADTVRALFEKDEILVQKRTKKKDYKTIDLKPALAASNPTVTETENGCVLEFTLPCSSADTVNPSLVMTALEEMGVSAPVVYTVRRLAVLDKDGEIFA